MPLYSVANFSICWVLDVRDVCQVCSTKLNILAVGRWPSFLFKKSKFPDASNNIENQVQWLALLTDILIIGSGQAAVLHR